MEKVNEKRYGPLQLAFMYVAFFCSITIVSSGGIIGAGSTFKEGFTGILAGCAFIAFLVFLSTCSSYKLGLRKDQLWAQVFGSKGYKLGSFVMAIALAFWAWFDFFNASQAIYNLMPDHLKNFGFILGIAILLVITILGGMFGLKGIAFISNLTIPIAVILFIIIIASAITNVGGMEGLAAFTPETHDYSVAKSADLVIATWICGTAAAPDLSEKAKNTRAVALASVATFGMIFVLFLVGQIGFIGTGFQTMGDICASLGGAIFIVGCIFNMIAQANTTPSCNYFYSNSFTELFRINRNFFVILIPCIAAAGGTYIMYSAGVGFITTIVGFISILLTPLLAIMISHYWLVFKGKHEFTPEKKLPAAYKPAIITLIIGIVLSLILKLFPSLGAPTVIVLVVTMVVYVIVYKAMTPASVTEDVQTES